ncbi:MAG TPA: hypothetical protein ENI82_04205 [Bacteroidetes bacterium]|nr:hypothetical protein [Bacteroidota bacterium]
MNFEDENLDLLQNIESGIISVYRENKSIKDAHVYKALNMVMEVTKKKLTGKDVPLPEAGEIETEIAEIIFEILTLRSFTNEDLKLNIFALKKIMKSIKFWNKKRGTRGYLTYVNSFFP